MVFEDDVPALDNLEHHFVKMCNARLEASGNGQLKVHKDAAYTENPMEREDIEESVKVVHSMSIPVKMNVPLMHGYFLHATARSWKSSISTRCFTHLVEIDSFKLLAVA